MDSPATTPLYARIARHYRGAIRTGALAPGDAMPSVRALTRLHRVSLSTALQACRSLEAEGLLEARPRSGYFVLRRRRAAIPPLDEPDLRHVPDAAQYVGIHDRVSRYVAMSERHPVRVDFAATYASPEAYPGADLQRAAMRALRRDPGLLVRPIAPNGDAGLRAALARRSLDAGMQLAPEQIVVTHGCIEALNVALRAVAQPGDTVAVESPTYYGLLQVLESLGLRALEIPTSPSTGLSVDALERALREPAGIKAVVVVPNLQNPLSCTMPDAAKERLVALCEQHALPLIEDDTYSAFHADDVPLRALKSFDRSGHVIHCASLRKTIAPGMRLGWMTGGRWQARIEMLKYAQSRANEALSQIAMAEFIGSSAHDRHLTRLRRALQHQREQMADAIAAHFPAGTRLSVPAGSMLLWVELPGQRSADAVFEAALAQGIRIAPGTLFSNSRRFDHFMRISCGTPFTSEADAGLRQLAAIVATG
ncbi:PLP-dependent aminotransferase family protein [Rhizobacter sp. Root404]|uniref:aminotransferase-like domain-containing protein n=1 Tax=Rhizobacter sp. Root404 TaxID=1736528 RepID=UPI0006FEF79A|nr:PLP-dependent aminotransferase family protein [Rhizobacter sp. Root404]KQW38924.1 2-aminoadipate aminotransferase [Rhizobacter sp. Root404]